jgi:hypothetical protein
MPEVILTFRDARKQPGPLARQSEVSRAIADLKIAYRIPRSKIPMQCGRVTMRLCGYLELITITSSN